MLPCDPGASWRRFPEHRFVVYSLPEIVRLTVGFHQHLVQVPFPVRVSMNSTDPLRANLSYKHRPKPIPPKSYSFMTDFDPSLVRQVFNIPQRQRKADIHHHRKANDFGACFEIAKRTAFCHPQRLGNTSVQLKIISSDSAQLTCPPTWQKK